MKTVSPEQQLAGFLAKYDAEIARTIKAVRAKMRARLSQAIEMVYDNCIPGVPNQTNEVLD